MGILGGCSVGGSSRVSSRVGGDFADSGLEAETGFRELLRKGIRKVGKVFAIDRNI